MILKLNLICAEKIVKMPNIELKYFPIHGFRGLLARLVLHLSGVVHTEKTIAFEDWQQEQSSKHKFFASENSTDAILATILGYLPELTVDGVTYAQLTPILNYLYQIGKMDRFGIIKYPQYNNHLMNH